MNNKYNFELSSEVFNDRLTMRKTSFILLILILLAWIGPSSCMLYDDFNMSGDYRLHSGTYYDGDTYDLENFEGTMKLGRSDYSVTYSFSFTDKHNNVITLTREEKGNYRHTSESERTVYGTNEKFWSGLMFFYPDTSETYGYRMKYEYLIRSKKLILDSSFEYSIKGYYTELEWSEVR